MNKKLIIFDMDGTLVNSSITIANAINFVRKNLGFEPMDAEDILRKVNDHTINPAQVFYHAKAFDAEHEKWFSQYYGKNHKHELVLYKGIRALLLTLKSKGHLLAVATNAHRNSTLKSLGHLEVLDLFDSVVCHDDVPQSKPHPDMLLKLLKELNITAEEALFIGDGPRDEIASQRANIDYIMVDWGFTEHENAVRSVEALEQILTKELS
jgi:phosphoglycolate phosphatase